MRISEKTIELNICAQINQAIGRQVIWFGLTQRQEAKAGFDATSHIAGRRILLQFKASDHVLKTSGARQFMLEHDQLAKLHARSLSHKQKVYYVFPMVGNTLEFQAVAGNLLQHTLLLDMQLMPVVIPPPTVKNGSRLRKHGLHYADVNVVNGQGKVIIHSDPFEVVLNSVKNEAEANFPHRLLLGGEISTGSVTEKGLQVEEFIHLLHPGLMMAVIPA